MDKVVILQEYVPQYRVPFFEKLHDEAKGLDIDVTVAYGSVGAGQATRKDARDISCGISISQKEWRFLGRRLVVRDISTAVAGADLIILEQARRNVDAYRLLATKSPNGPAMALWGHGKDYTHRTSALDRGLSRWLTSRADWFFAYTNGGVAAVVDAGLPIARSTVVQNSIDTASLRASVRRIEDTSVRDFSQNLGLKGKTALFLGALDSSKRLEFLELASRNAHNTDPDFRLLIAGEGPLRSQVEAWSRSHSWMTYLGAVTGHEKSKAMAASQILAMPGRVGLVAVDSFAAELPIVTTDWPWHAPEFEYLNDGQNALVTRDNEVAYAAAMVEVMNNTKLLGDLRRGAGRDADTYTVQAMVSRFLAGISGALAMRIS